MIQSEKKPMLNTFNYKFFISGIVFACSCVLAGAQPVWAGSNWIGPDGKPSTPPSGWTSSVPLIAKADVAAGEKLAQTCGSCHTFDKDGGTKFGPNLYGIVNRKHAHLTEFTYSDAIKSMNMRPWDYEELDSFLFDPKLHAPGTRMPFAGIKDTQQRANVIAYLRTLADKPAALPK